MFKTVFQRTVWARKFQIKRLYSSQNSRWTHSALRFMQSNNFSMLWLVSYCVSELIYVIKVQGDYENYVNKAQAKIHVLKDIINRVKRGENVDVEKELVGLNQSVDLSVDDIIAELEKLEENLNRPKEGNLERNVGENDEKKKRKPIEKFI